MISIEGIRVVHLQHLNRIQYTKFATYTQFDRRFVLMISLICLLFSSLVGFSKDYYIIQNNELIWREYVYESLIPPLFNLSSFFTLSLHAFFKFEIGFPLASICLFVLFCYIARFKVDYGHKCFICLNKTLFMR